MTSLYRKILALAIPIFMAVGMFAVVPQAVHASPADAVIDGIDAAGDPNNKCGPKGDKHECTIADSIQAITNVLLFVIGAVSVIMIIVGGLRYTTSNGDSTRITAAKNTILYSVIGLVVALLAYVIVDFVIIQFT